MSLLAPPRIHTLDPQSIRIVIHTGHAQTEETTVRAYPFQSLLYVKQQLALAHLNDKTWLPNVLFVAQAAATAGLYRPVEFVWPFGDVQDPFVPDVLGQPDKRIYAQDSRLPVFPTIRSNVNIEQALTGDRTLHVWKLSDLATAARYQATSVIPESVFEGYFSLYFPSIQSREVLMDIFAPLSDADRDAFRTAEQYRDHISRRLSKLDAELARMDAASRPVTMRELRRLRYVLPVHPTFVSSVLELKFYEMNPSTHVPFIRFFPSNERTAPIVKLAMNEMGLPRISDTRLLDLLLADQPSGGNILLLKYPIHHPRAPLGTTWSMRVFEDGSAEIYMGAPRKDAPVPHAVVEEAFRVLPDFLAAVVGATDTVWNVTALRLVEIGAVYEFVTQLTGSKPTVSEMKGRLDPFLPLFKDEPVLKGLSAQLSLRYKAVSNYVADQDPIMNYITNLFYRSGGQSIESAPIQDVFLPALAIEFGLPARESVEYIQRWVHRAGEFGTDEIPTTNLGCVVDVYNTHPKYLFYLNNVESEVDLQRILSLLALFVSRTAAELRTTDAASTAVAADVIADAEAAATPPPEALPELTEEELMFAAEFMDGVAAEEDVPAADAVADAIHEAAAPVQALPVPKPLAEGEILPKQEKEWHLSRLKVRDPVLFGYSMTGYKKFSVACQSSQEKQPHVMAAETYARVRELYRDLVFWVEAPLSPYDLTAAVAASSAVGERHRADKVGPSKTYDELVALEKRALRLGFALEGDKSITGLPSYKSKVRKEDVEEITALMAAQKHKPLWTVIRLGTDMDKPNYYICSEYWCIRDDLPLIPSQFVGTTMFTGEPKAPNSCAFCGGRLIENIQTLKPGETVLQRQPTTKGGPVAKYVGFIKKLHHPDNFALPCCFASPDNLKVPTGAVAIPDPKVPLPDIQRPDELAMVAAPPADDGVVAAPPPPDAAVDVAMAVTVAADALDEYKARPFTGKRTGAQNQWYIPKQKVLGRTSEGWLDLERGAVGVPPKSVNALLGQDPEKFLTAIKGAFAVSQNSYLATQASAFVRYGIGGIGAVREPGTSLLNLIAYAQYATDHLTTEDDKLAIQPASSVLHTLFGERQYQMARAFLQANYGTLLHEFSRPVLDLPADREVEFQTWWGRMGFTRPEQRAYAIQAFLAWDNFRNYVHDLKEPKDLRLWQSLFAIPGLLTRTGFLVVTIVYPKAKDAPAIIQCPDFGMAYRYQKTRIPFLFVVQDAASGMYDPLVFYEGVNKDEKHLLGVIHPETPAFGKLSPVVREALQGFIASYMSPLQGCGREAAPVHPWMPVADSTHVPKFGDFIDSVGRSDTMPVALARDRSNRLVGVVVQWERGYYYLPVVDDGHISMYLPSIRGEGAIPTPTLDKVIDMLMGKQNIVREKKLAALFPAYVPVSLKALGEHFIAVELACGAWIPIEPLPLTSEIAHKRFAELKRKFVQTDFVDALPWSENARILVGDIKTPERTSEEALDDAYAHLRISFSNWLHNSEQGTFVRNQIELLRQARKRLPLFELQKRLDLLLTSIIARPSQSWITTDGSSQDTLLRRDCLQITRESDCKGGCSWSTASGKCLIHTTATPRYMDPVRVMIARLVDELLRSFGLAQEILQQRVPYLKPLSETAILRQDDGRSLIFSTSGRGDDELFARLGYTGRKPSAYTRGLTYPEEVGLDVEDTLPNGLPVDWVEILQHAVFAADIARDPLARFQASLALVGNVAFPELEAAVGRSLRGTLDDWRAVAQHIHTDVLLTRLNPERQTMELDRWIRGDSDGGVGAAVRRRYVMIDLQGIPLQHKKSGALVFTDATLPESVRRWMDAHDRE